MSRTTRTYPYGDEAFHKGQRESTCKPGCGSCEKGPAFRRRRLIRKLSDSRKKANLTRAEVADRLGKTEEYIEELEAYYSNPTLSEIRGYALAVGAELSLDLKLHLG